MLKGENLGDANKLYKLHEVGTPFKELQNGAEGKEPLWEKE